MEPRVYEIHVGVNEALMTADVASHHLEGLRTTNEKGLMGQGPKHENIGKAWKFRTMVFVGNLYRGQDKDTVFGISLNWRYV
jgi:hypothetical protein